MSLPNRVQTDAAIGLVRSRLLALTEIQALVSGRIIGSNASDPDYGTVTKPAIAIEVDAGSGGYVGAIAQLQITVGVLSQESASAARAIYDVVRAGLQAEGLADETTLHRGTIIEQGWPSDSWMEVAKCYVCAGTWNMFVVRDQP